MGKITVETCEIEGLKVITPTVFGDARGYFMETYHYEDYFSLRLIRFAFGVVPNEFGQNQCFCRCLRYLKCLSMTSWRNLLPASAFAEQEERNLSVVIQFSM